MERSVFSLLSMVLRREIEAFSWESATEIQALAIPVILRGENVLLIAPTGTGKTEAAVLPVFEMLLRERSESRVEGISILYITPLRALNRDIFMRLTKLGERLDIEVQVRHGDTTKYMRRKQALHPPDMLITTPETFQAILPGKRMSRHLSSIRWVVVDEVHELASDKRGAQLTIGLERLSRIAHRDFQRIGLSATVGRPDLIARFLCGWKRRFRILNTAELKDLVVWVESPTPEDKDREMAKEVMLSPGSVKRVQRLFELCEAYKSSLIFTNTREHAEALSSRMIALKPGVTVDVHHGSLSKAARVEVEKGLKEGGLKAVVCTSSLELGIDVGNIEFVVQYLSPRQATRLVQRVGRSGHVVSGMSRGCIIAAWPDDILESAVISKLARDGFLESPRIHEKALDVLAHQVAGLALDWGRISLYEAHEIVSRAWPYRELGLEELADVAKQLEENKIVWFNGDIIGKRYPKTLHYYYENLSMITSVRRYGVVDLIRRKRVGELDQEFIAKNGEIGREFIMRGQTWRILSIDDEENIIQVEPVQHSFGAIPSWEGEMIPVPFEVAQEAGKLRGEIAEYIKGVGRGLMPLRNYPIDYEAASKIIDIVKRQLEKGYPVPTDKLVLIECFENYAIIHGCFGNLVNEAIGKALAYLLSSRLGVNIGTQVDAYHIALASSHRLNPKIVSNELLNIGPEDLEPVLTETLAYTALFAWRLWNVAKRFGFVSREAEFRTSLRRVLASALEGTPIHAEALREIYTEKMDLKKAIEVLERIRDGVIKVEATYSEGEYSPLSIPILDRLAPQDVLRPLVPTKSLIEVVRKRLETEETRLVCVFKGDYSGVVTIRRAGDRIKCPGCGSTLLAATHPRDRALVKIVKKKISKRKLTAEEEASWQKAWKNASLVQNYGKKALIALAARGVGPTNAARILQSYHRTEDDFYMDIIRAERDYARTRMFWDK